MLIYFKFVKVFQTIILVCTSKPLYIRDLERIKVIRGMRLIYVSSLCVKWKKMTMLAAKCFMNGRGCERL